MTSYTSRFSTALAALALFFCACSSKTEQPAAQPAAAPKTAERGTAPRTEVAATEVSIPRSVFTIDQNSRDPFFPKAKAAQAEDNTPQTEVALDVPSVLRANFHGIITQGDKSIAYINNITLETGRQAVIPIRAGGKERQVAVRCLDVTRDAVVLEVQGYAQPVRITRPFH